MHTFRETPTLHIIDLENHLVARGRKISVDDVHRWWLVYKQHFVRPDDLVLVGVSPRTARWLRAFAGDRVQARVGHTGPDGADDALLASVYVPDMAERFPRWVIASGDGAFTGLAKHGSQRGVLVQLVTTGATLVAPKLAAAVAVRSKIRLTARQQVQRANDAIHTVRAASVAA